MPDDLTTVLEWARKHGPPDVENAACRVLDWITKATELVDERLAVSTLGRAREEEG